MYEKNIFWTKNDDHKKTDRSKHGKAIQRSKETQNVNPYVNFSIGFHASNWKSSNGLNMNMKLCFNFLIIFSI